MSPGLICLGSIGTLAETSELQRESFNAAFAEAGHDLHWDPKSYGKRLARSGGRQRVAEYAAERGAAIDAAAIHVRKTEIFQTSLSKDGVPLRPGVAAVLSRARQDGTRLALATTTSRANVDSILGAAGLDAAIFDFIGDSGIIENPKPAPDIYREILRRFAAEASRAVAIEDNPDGATAALAAGLATVAFPGALHRPETFPEAVALTAFELDYDRLAALV